MLDWESFFVVQLIPRRVGMCGFGGLGVCVVQGLWFGDGALVWGFNLGFNIIRVRIGVGMTWREDELSGS